MKYNHNTISVFEHERISLDDNGPFKQEHFKALVKFNDLHGGKYFTVGFNKITFKSYVGVIQAGNRAIEILPKADRNRSLDEHSQDKWRKALLYMLNRAGYIRLNETQQASQGASRHNLLDVYLYTFLQEVTRLVHRGLVKKYHRTTSNGNTLKGRLLVHRQIRDNLVHKERFFTEHAVYDNNHVLNGILKKALMIIVDTTHNYGIKQEASQLLLHFEGVAVWFGQLPALEHLSFDRKSEHYTYAIDIAKLIILNFSPDMSAGGYHVLAILFDMNRLFEKFVYKCLKRCEPDFVHRELSVAYQQRKEFWKDKALKPDIVISYRCKEKLPHKMIVDIKWKIVEEDEPADEDLRQMYTYNLQFGASKSILFYPRTHQVNREMVAYAPGDGAPGIAHGCGLYFADLFCGGNKVSEGFVREFLDEQVEEGPHKRNGS